MKKATLWLLLVAILGMLMLGGCEPDTKPDIKGIRPIVFVHGMAGTGDQFQTQALRFASNGYPDHYFVGFDHNTILDLGRERRLDAAIDAIRRETGADMVDLVGHSMGTTVSQKYLSKARQAAKVAHYVNVDGSSADELPGGVPSMSILATDLAGEIAGGINIYLTSHTHVQAVSSPEAFVHMYEFFTGEAPSTTEVLPSADSTIVLKGRLVNFITNSVPEDITMSIYEVDPATGHRLSRTPDHVQTIGSDGNFNFPDAKQGASYEFRAARPSVQVEEGHWYYEPFVRTDTLIRLKYNEPGSALYNLIDSSDDTACVIVVRNREMQGVDTNGAGMDSITINGSEICAGILPGGTGVNDSGPIGLVVFDEDIDGVSDLSGVSDAFSSVPFVYGVDLVIPGAPSAGGTVNVVVVDRYSHRTQTINVPNWDSAVHKMFVQFLPH